MKIYLSIAALWLISSTGVAQVDRQGTGLYNATELIHYPWLSVGINVGRQYNYAHVAGRVPIPSIGTTELNAIPTTNFGLRVQREFSPHWLWRAGLDVSEFGFRLLTAYEGGGWSRANFLRQQAQASLAVQYYPLRYVLFRIRPYVRVGILANLMGGPPTESIIVSRRRVDDLPPYLDLINFTTEPWVRPGLALGFGFSRRIRSGFTFDLAFVAYRGFSELTDISYRVERETQTGLPEELLSTKIINRGSFIGFEGSIYLPPFRFKKIQRKLEK